jgi:hypothetical protein
MKIEAQIALLKVATKNPKTALDSPCGLGICVLDRVIVGREGYGCFSERDLHFPSNNGGNDNQNDFGFN